MPFTVILEWGWTSFLLRHCKIPARFYNGFTVAIVNALYNLQWVYSEYTMSRGSYIVNLQWFYSAVDGERWFFYSGSGKIRLCHCIILQCAYCKFTVWLLYSHCIPFVKAICFASISEPVPTVNLQCSGSAHCKFTMRGSGSTVNLQCCSVKIQCTQPLCPL